MHVCIFGAIWWVIHEEDDWPSDCGKPEEPGVPLSLPGGLNPGNAAVGVLAAAKIFTKGSFNRIKKNKYI